MKRLMDIVVSAGGLLVLFPVILVIAILVRLRLGSPIVFSQDRPGRDEAIFRLRKFRTMSDQRDEDGNLLPDSDRLTRFGQFLRRSSLDELPTLWNVLIGDMSLVGPRPLLVEYLPLYSDVQRRRHAVRPGITGWAQVNGRNAISWEDKFAYDVWYVEHASLALDLKILMLTLGKVLRREGISQPGEATMTRFTGTESQSDERSSESS
ncbi:MAG: sugar transferase [Woeseiaceae bacterium]|nr:sugar transferase [Woeseiaceae bacterium]